MWNEDEDEDEDDGPASTTEALRGNDVPTALKRSVECRPMVPRQCTRAFIGIMFFTTFFIIKNVFNTSF
jgi:hypothetical protein